MNEILPDTLERKEDAIDEVPTEKDEYSEEEYVERSKAKLLQHFPHYLLKYVKFDQPAKEEFHILNEEPFFLGSHNFKDYRVIREYKNCVDDDSVKLYYTRLEPKATPLASICIVHGFGEYSSRYLEVKHS